MIRFHISRHHAERLELRGISQEDVKTVVCHGQKSSAPGKPKNGGKVWKFEKTERGKTLIVVVEINREEYYLITTYERT